jgi:hypothetical protein
MSAVFRGALSVLVVTVLHAVITLGLLVYAFAAGMKKFDEPAYQLPTSATVAGAAGEVFMLPVAPLWSRWASTHLPNGLELIFFGLNSALWAFALVAFAGAVTHRPQREARIDRARVSYAGSVVLLAIAFLAALFAAGIDGRPGDVMIELNGYRSGDSVARAVEATMAVLIGGGGVFLLLSARRMVRNDH